MFRGDRLRIGLLCVVVGAAVSGAAAPAELAYSYEAAPEGKGSRLRRVRWRFPQLVSSLSPPLHVIPCSS